MYIVAKVNDQAIYSHSVTNANKGEVKVNVENAMINMGYKEFIIVESEENPFESI